MLMLYLGGGLNTYVLWGGGGFLNPQYLPNIGGSQYLRSTAGVTQCLRKARGSSMLMLYWGGGAKYLRFMGGGGGFLNPQYLPNIGGSQYLRSTGGVTQCLRKTRGPQCLCYIGGGGGA